MQIAFDTSTWTDYQIGMLQNVFVELLFAQGITYDSLYCFGGICDIENPSGTFSIDENDILTQLASDDAIRAANELADDGD